MKQKSHTFPPQPVLSWVSGPAVFPATETGAKDPANTWPAGLERSKAKQTQAPDPKTHCKLGYPHAATFISRGLRTDANKLFLSESAVQLALFGVRIAH